MKRIRRLLVRGVLGVVIVTVVPWVLLRWVPPPTSAFMLERRIAGLISGHGGANRYRWVAWDGISPNIRVAVVAAEDRKYGIGDPATQITRVICRSWVPKV